MEYTHINKEEYENELNDMPIERIERIQKGLKRILNFPEYRQENPPDKAIKLEQLHIINNYLTKKYTENI